MARVSTLNALNSEVSLAISLSVMSDGSYKMFKKCFKFQEVICNYFQSVIWNLNIGLKNTDY